MMMPLQATRPWRICGLAVVVALFALGWADVTAAQEKPMAFPRQISTTVSDYAMVIPEEAQQGLEARLQRLRAETGVQIAVVTLNGIPGGESALEPYATALFNNWGIGRADRNDGILLLYSAPDSAVRLELGRAYGQGYDVLAQDIVSRVLVPALREGRTGEALTNGLTETIDRIALPFAQGRAAEPPLAQSVDWLGYAVPAVMVLGFGAILWRKRQSGRGAQGCPQCGAALATDTGPILSDGRKRLVTCPNCGWAGPVMAGHHDRPDSTGNRERGGEGGFGGGSSSGGGASGRW